MPPIQRSNGIPIGQIGPVQQITQRAPDSGIGSILQKAAQAEFGAAQTVADTASKYGALGAEQTAIAISTLDELNKPFARIKANRETTMSNGIARRAQLQLRAGVNTMESNNAITPDQYGSVFNTDYERVRNGALLEAQKISPAAMEHVEGNLQVERLSLFTHILGSATSRDLHSQLGELTEQEDFLLGEATSARDPAVREAHKQKYFTQLDQAVFNNAITPAVGEQRRQWFNKRLQEESVTQSAIEKGLPETFTMIDNLPATTLPTEKAELRNRATSAVSHKVAEAKTSAAAAERQLKIDQGAQATTFRNVINGESDPNKIQAIVSRVPEYIKSGVLDKEDGNQLITHGQSRLEELKKPQPIQDNPLVFDRILTGIIDGDSAITPVSINKEKELSVQSRIQLIDRLNGSNQANHFSNLPAYKQATALIQSFDVTKSPSLDQKLAGTLPPNMGERVRRVLIAYERKVQRMMVDLKRNPLDEEVAALDSWVEAQVKGISATTWSGMPGSTLQSIKP